MVNVTLDELRLNAIFAALHEREFRLGAELSRLARQPESQDREYAMDSVTMAIQHSFMTRRDLTAAIPEPELPAEMTFDHAGHLSAEPDPSCADCQEASAAMWQRMAV